MNNLSSDRNIVSILQKILDVLLSMQNTIINYYNKKNKL